MHGFPTSSYIYDDIKLELASILTKDNLSNKQKDDIQFLFKDSFFEQELTTFNVKAAERSQAIIDLFFTDNYYDEGLISLLIKDLVFDSQIKEDNYEDYVSVSANSITDDFLAKGNKLVFTSLVNRHYSTFYICKEKKQIFYIDPFGCSNGINQLFNYLQQESLFKEMIRKRVEAKKPAFVLSLNKRYKACFRAFETVELSIKLMNSKSDSDSQKIQNLIAKHIAEYITTNLRITLENIEIEEGRAKAQDEIVGIKGNIEKVSSYIEEIRQMLNGNLAKIFADNKINGFTLEEIVSWIARMQQEIISFFNSKLDNYCGLDNEQVTHLIAQLRAELENFHTLQLKLQGYIKNIYDENIEPLIEELTEIGQDDAQLNQNIKLEGYLKEYLKKYNKSKKNTKLEEYLKEYNKFKEDIILKLKSLKSNMSAESVVKVMSDYLNQLETRLAGDYGELQTQPPSESILKAAKYIKELYKTEGYKIFYSKTRVQKDTVSCGAITAEMIRLLYDNFQSVSEALELKQNNSDTYIAVELDDIFKGEAKDQLKVIKDSFSEKKNNIAYNSTDRRFYLVSSYGQEIKLSHFVTLSCFDIDFLNSLAVNYKDFVPDTRGLLDYMKVLITNIKRKREIIISHKDGRELFLSSLFKIFQSYSVENYFFSSNYHVSEEFAYSDRSNQSCNSICSSVKSDSLNNKKPYQHLEYYFATALIVTSISLIMFQEMTTLNFIIITASIILASLIVFHAVNYQLFKSCRYENFSDTDSNLVCSDELSDVSLSDLSAKKKILISQY